MRSAALVIVLSLVSISHPAAMQSQVRPREVVVGGLGRGDILAVVEAERSGDRTLMPFIVTSFEIAKLEGRPLSPEYVAAARHAIVALADRRQLQEMWCRAVKEDALIPDVAPLGVVGGWFGIRGLQELLKPERQKNWEHANGRRPARDRDVMYLSPRRLALTALSETVQNPPVTRNEALFSPYAPLVNRWDDWIAANRAELEKLEPTGEGVEYSEGACKNGKPVR